MKTWFWRTLAVSLLTGSVILLRVVTGYGMDEPVPWSGNAESPSQDTNTGATGPLRVLAANPRYFTDGSGKVVYLTGSHTWSNFTDSGDTNPPPVFDYEAYLDFLTANNHNFFRLWRAENAQGGEAGVNYWFQPMPYVRTGPGVAQDGQPKFDLTQLDQAYFDRLRARVAAAGARGIYVSILLFDGWSVQSKFGSHVPWYGHPYNGKNNINGVDGDLNQDGSGEETHTLTAPISPTITSMQEAYVRKVIDTVNDLDNVLYEISNESPGNSEAWQYHMINTIKAYEATKPKQHPVGMTVEWPNGSNADLYASSADWISPNGDVNNPPAADGTKVILNDTDHLCGICGDRAWVWKSLARGMNPIFMDPYDGVDKERGSCSNYDPNNANDVSIRSNLGYARTLANRMNLLAAVPRGDLCSTGYCLANAAVSSAEYLVYQPVGGPFMVNLSSTPGTLDVEWLNPATGALTTAAAVTGGAIRSFTPPFGGDAVLFLQQPGGTLPTPTIVATNTPEPPATATITPIVPTATFTPLPTATGTTDPTIAPTDMPTGAATNTPTATYTPVAPTATATPTNTPTRTPTSTPTQGLFPSTSVLDDFGRSDGLIGSNWSGATSGYRIVASQLDVGNTEDIYWAATPFGADQQAFVTFVKIDSASNEHAVILKAQSSGGVGAGMIDVLYNPTNRAIEVWTYDTGNGWRMIGASIPITFIAGDVFGARARADGIVEVYRNGGLVGTRNVTGWPYAASGGYIGLYLIGATNAILDNFGGGNTGTSVAPTPTSTPTALPPTATATATPPPTATNTPAPPPTFTPTATNTPVPPPTFTPTATNTPAPPTFTPTATNTPEPPTFTPTATNTPEPPPTFTPTATNTPEPPPTFTPTATNTPAPPATFTPTATATATATPVPFPVSAVVDNFNRANGGIGTKWGGKTSGYRIANNRLDVGTTKDIYWKPSVFGANQEAYVTLSAIDAQAAEIGLLLKAQSRTGLGNGVVEVFYNPSRQAVRVSTYTSTGGWVQRGTDIPGAFGNGDQLGARAFANGQVEIFRNGQLLGTRDVSAWKYFNRTGYIGILCSGAANALLDDFGGGTIAVTAAAPGDAPPDLAVTLPPQPLHSAPATATYVVDVDGRPRILAGAYRAGDPHAAEEASGESLPGAYLSLMAANQHNLVWMPLWPPDGWPTPAMVLDTMDGEAGRPYDLAEVDPQYLAGVRQAVEAAGANGLYAAIVLFDARGLTADSAPDHAAHAARVRQVVTALNEYDNLLFMVTDAGDDLTWQLAQVEAVHNVEQALPKRHLVGVSVATLADLDSATAAPVDFVMATGDAASQPEAPGIVAKPLLVASRPASPATGPAWVWQVLLAGHSLLVLEPTPSAVPPADDADWNGILATVGEAQELLNRVGSAGLVPRPDLCSSERCLAGGTPGAAELLVYVPGGGEVAIDLSAVPDAFATSWLELATGKDVPGEDVAGGQVVRLVAPAGDDTVLHLRQQRQATNLFLPSVLR